MYLWLLLQAHATTPLGASSMLGNFVVLSIVAAMMLPLPIRATFSESTTQRHEKRVDGNDVNRVIYFDAPIHSVPTYRR
jgi:hypothetical protein